MRVIVDATQLDLPAVKVLSDGTYTTVLIKPTIRGGRRERLLAAARAGLDLDDIDTVPEAFDERGLPVVHLARVVEYDVPDREGNGSGELIVLLSTVLDPADARADELASAYHERWEQDRSPRDQRPDRKGLRGSGPGSGPDLLRQGLAPGPPYRHRDGGHSPLRTGLIAYPSTWPPSRNC
jgi:hypothetical protein